MTYAGRPHATPEQVDHEVEVRIQRQEILHRANPPTLWAIIDEPVLRRRVGNPDIMRAQLRHLLEIGDLPHVIIQILPEEAGMHPGEVGAFIILDLEDQSEIVWHEGPCDGRFIDRPEQVAECARRYDYLRAMALSPAASRTMIATLLEETCASPMPTGSLGARPATAPAKAAHVSK